MEALECPQQRYVGGLCKCDPKPATPKNKARDLGNLILVRAELQAEELELRREFLLTILHLRSPASLRCRSSSNCSRDLERLVGLRSTIVAKSRVLSVPYIARPRRFTSHRLLGV